MNFVKLIIALKSKTSVSKTEEKVTRGQHKHLYRGFFKLISMYQLFVLSKLSHPNIETCNNYDTHQIKLFFVKVTLRSMFEMYAIFYNVNMQN